MNIFKKFFNLIKSWFTTAEEEVKETQVVNNVEVTVDDATEDTSESTKTMPTASEIVKEVVDKTVEDNINKNTNDYDSVDVTNTIVDVTPSNKNNNTIVAVSDAIKNNEVVNVDNTNKQTTIAGEETTLGEGIVISDTQLKVDDVVDLGNGVEIVVMDEDEYKKIVDESNKKGDVNGDGVVDVSDVSALTNEILNGKGDNKNADVNGDGVVDIADVTTLNNEILNGKANDKDTEVSTHDEVDDSSNQIIATDVQTTNQIIDTTTVKATDTEKADTKQVLTEISAHQYQNDKNLRKMTIETAINKIGASAFYGCINLESIIMESEVPPTLGMQAFQYRVSRKLYILPKLTIYVPVNSVDAYKVAKGWEKYTTIIKASK